MFWDGFGCTKTTKRHTLCESFWARQALVVGREVASYGFFVLVVVLTKVLKAFLLLSDVSLVLATSWKLPCQYLAGVLHATKTNKHQESTGPGGFSFRKMNKTRSFSKAQPNSQRRSCWSLLGFCPFSPLPSGYYPTSISALAGMGTLGYLNVDDSLALAQKVFRARNRRIFLHLRARMFLKLLKYQN